MLNKIIGNKTGIKKFGSTLIHFIQAMALLLLISGCSLGNDLLGPGDIENTSVVTNPDDTITKVNDSLANSPLNTAHAVDSVYDLQNNTPLVEVTPSGTINALLPTAYDQNNLYYYDADTVAYYQFATKNGSTWLVTSEDIANMMLGGQSFNLYVQTGAGTYTDGAQTVLITSGSIPDITFFDNQVQSNLVIENGTVTSSFTGLTQDGPYLALSFTKPAAITITAVVIAKAEDNSAIGTLTKHATLDKWLIPTNLPQKNGNNYLNYKVAFRYTVGGQSYYTRGTTKYLYNFKNNTLGSFNISQAALSTVNFTFSDDTYNGYDSGLSMSLNDNGKKIRNILFKVDSPQSNKIVKINGTSVSPDIYGFYGSAVSGPAITVTIGDGDTGGGILSYVTVVNSLGEGYKICDLVNAPPSVVLSRLQAGELVVKETKGKALYISGQTVSGNPQSFRVAQRVLDNENQIITRFRSGTIIATRDYYNGVYYYKVLMQKLADISGRSLDELMGDKMTVTLDGDVLIVF